MMHGPTHIKTALIYWIPQSVAYFGRAKPTSGLYSWHADLKSNVNKTRYLIFCTVGSCTFYFTALYSATKWLNMSKTWNLLWLSVNKCFVSGWCLHRSISIKLMLIFRMGIRHIELSKVSELIPNVIPCVLRLLSLVDISSDVSILKHRLIHKGYIL
jgi:hypothetical protein